MDFAKIMSEAQAAGLAAGRACNPTPMHIIGYAPVADGACGFAWVTIKPATSPFGRWLKANGQASKAYGGGLQIWIGEHNQSLERKTAHARAMAAVLREAFPDLRIFAGSRID